MPLISFPRCPNCGAAVSLRKLWEVAPTSRYNILIGQYGVTCPSCFVKLCVLQGGTKVAALLLLFMPAALFVYWLREFSPSDTLVGLAAILGLSVVIPAMAVVPPRYARLRQMRSEEQLSFPLDSQASSAER